MRSTDKKVKMAIRKHILESFDDYDESPEDAMGECLDGAVFLAYCEDIVDYLNSIGLEKYTLEEIEEMPERKSNAALEKAADLYYNLIVREGTQMYYEIKEGRYKGPGKTVSENKKREGMSRRH